MLPLPPMGPTPGSVVMVIWLVVEPPTYPSEKWWSEFVSWDDGIPNIWNKYKNHIPNHQPENGDSLFFHPFDLLRVKMWILTLKNLSFTMKIQGDLRPEKNSRVLDDAPWFGSKRVDFTRIRATRSPTASSPVRQKGDWAPAKLQPKKESLSGSWMCSKNPGLQSAEYS